MKVSDVTPHSLILLILDLTEGSRWSHHHPYPSTSGEPPALPGMPYSYPCQRPGRVTLGYLLPLLYPSSLRSPGGHKYGIPI
jgi:hypothetical protein